MSSKQASPYKRFLKSHKRINKTPVVAVEIHVVSNQDRVAQQIFDLRLDRVPTEEKLRSINQAIPYSLNTLDFVKWKEEEPGYEEIFTKSREAVQTALHGAPFTKLNGLMDFALIHHEVERSFWILEAMLSSPEIVIWNIAGWILRYPHLVFKLLKIHLGPNPSCLSAPFDAIRQPIIDAVVLSVNDAPYAALFALEKLAFDIAELSFSQYTAVLWTASMVVRGRQTVQETLIVLHEQRKRVESNPDIEHAHRQALQIALERAEDAFESCPCDEQGRPSRQRNPPIRVRLHPKVPKPPKPTAGSAEVEAAPTNTVEEPSGPSPDMVLVVADIRVDKPSTARLHSHVRLGPASRPEKQTMLWRREIMDGIIKVSFRGEVEIELFHHPPPEYAKMEWSLYDCGSTATTRAMMDAIKRLYNEKFEACAFNNLLTGTDEGASTQEESEDISTDGPGWEGFNDSQKQAIKTSFLSNLSLIWGPPGTGKTTVIVKILELLVRQLDEDSQILMTASTHNAVDNVLERFAQKNSAGQWIPDDAMVRAATDHNKAST
ncbi:hypothetical protein M408DRAFT_240126 [Serendipita vermifera MAFF 305830]|uniref:DNA2/NAM7 helicase helicase domain-containing protein n=1 Tax=Serendipita vermifera MAFF 305830 TaxID=933852 RepID=A0A0C3BK59_SERVB|nr:hypothetical protein M408DRAFT_240126 [Serendipita vermifera MAFF 305830]